MLAADVVQHHNVMHMRPKTCRFGVYTPSTTIFLHFDCLS